MEWVLAVVGNIVGGILSALSRRDRENVPMRFIALMVPFGFGVAFWYLRIKSGSLFSQLGAVQSDRIVSRVASVAVTTAVFALISKGIGFLIVKYFEK